MPKKGKNRESMASQSFREAQSAEKKNESATVRVAKPLSEVFAPVGKVSTNTMITYAAKHPKVLEQILSEVSTGGKLTHLYDPDYLAPPEYSCSTRTENGSILCMNGIAFLRLLLLQTKTAEKLITVSQTGDWNTVSHPNTVQLTLRGTCQICKTQANVSEFFYRTESAVQFVLNVGRRTDDCTFTVWEYRLQYLMPV